MGHHNHSTLTLDPWFIGVIVVAVVLLIGGIIWFIHRRTRASDGLSPAEREKLGFWECEILSMLRQHGGPMRQDIIVDALTGDLEEMTEAIKNLETEDLVYREWKADERTFAVSVKQ